LTEAQVGLPECPFCHAALAGGSADDAGSSHGSADESQATFLSDAFARDSDSAESAPGSGSAPGSLDSSATFLSDAFRDAESATLDSDARGDHELEPTVPSENFEFEADSHEPAAPSAADSAATFLSDELTDDSPTGSSVTSSLASSDQGDSYSQTLISDDFSQGAPSDAQTIDSKTIDSGSGEAGPDESSVTLLSGEDVSAEELRTLSSKWSGSESAAPHMTIKSRPDAAEDSLSARDTLDTLPRRKVRSGGDDKIIHPEYELVKVLGEGGMGVVWDARQNSVDRSVALKMIKGNVAGKRSQRLKFLAEAVVTGDLDHPNIVPIYDVATDVRGTLFYAMKQVQGTPWLKVIKKKTVHENLEILLRVCDAVAFAHARGIIHRDLKPENVMLGEYGEVLVMDWGLALPLEKFHKDRRIRFSTSMGGTPAYMAPEMASGPVDRVTEASDIYLLGGILYEIVTGKPPHPGKKVKECLLAAMRNVIVPTEKTGELVDIARKAMSKEPGDRYPTVQAFQAAIRAHLSHEESIAMAGRARDDLRRATDADDYNQYSKAVFGFEEAYDLWDGNAEARQGVIDAKLAYARSALRKGDYDLGVSLLDASLPEHVAVHDQLRAAQREREARQQRLKLAKRAIVGLAASIFAIGTVAFLWIRSERDEAHRQRGIAQDNFVEAEKQRNIAVEQKDIANEQRGIAQTNFEEAEKQRKIAVEQKDIADEQRGIAQTNFEKAEQARAEEEYSAYVARIGLAAAKIDENAFDVARGLLDDCKPELRNWEWGRLMHLCRQASEVFSADGPVDSIAVAPDGSRFAAASWDATVRIRDLASGEIVHTLKQPSLYVHAVAWSPDGRLLATGGSDPSGFVQIWDAASGERLSAVTGHRDAVVGVRFSPDGRWLLSCSYDETARLWDLSDVRTPRDVFTFKGHNWWVWDGAFSPDFAPEDPAARIVTVSQDGKAIVWRPVGQKSEVGSQTSEVRVKTSEVGVQTSEVAFIGDRVFTGHTGPVFGVAFAPDGGSVATAGYDKRVLLWRPDDVEPFDFATLLDGDPPAPKFREFAGESGHIAPVQSVAFSRDGTLLVSGSRDNSVKVWSVETAQPVNTFRGHHSGVRDAVFTPDGRRVISGGQDQQAIVWNIDEYEELRVLQGFTLAGHTDAVLSADFSRDGGRIVTASKDRTARTWDLRTGKLLHTFQEGHEYLTSSAVFFPDGRTLVTAAADDSVRFWNVTAGTQSLRLRNTGRSAALALSDDAQWLVTGSNDDNVKLWNVADLLADGADPQPVALSGHNGRVTCVAFASGRNVFAAGDANGRCILWDAQARRPLWSVRHHTRRINAVAFLDEGRFLLTASSDHTVSCMDVATGAEVPARILKLGAPVTALAVSRDGTRMLTVSDLEHDQNAFASRMTLWNAADAAKVCTLDLTDFAVNTVTFSPDGRVALATCSDNAVRYLPLHDGSASGDPAPQSALRIPHSEPFLDFRRLGGLVWSAAFTRDGASVLTLGGSDARLFDARSGRESMTFSPHGTVASARFSPDGAQIVTGSWDNSAKIWNSDTAKSLLKLEGEDSHTSFINSTVFSPDGTRILTASDDGTAKLWDAKTGRVLLTFTGHADRVRSAVFSADGRLVLTASSDRTARLWNAGTAEPVGDPFVGHEWAVLCAEFSPDGTRIVTGGEDNEARLWDVATRKTIALLKGHIAFVTSVAFSRDGARVFTASQDNTAKLWDATAGHEGTEILTLKAHSQEVTSIAVSPDPLGRYVLTGSRDGTAIVWLTADWTTGEKPAVARGGR
jgi:WD40 repeat protein/serine/threonine protein kinase